MRGRTGLVFDSEMAEHFSPWDSEHVENPERLLRAKARCDELGLTENCQMIKTRKATKDEMLLCHSEEYLDQIRGVVFVLFLKYRIFSCLTSCFLLLLYI